MLQFHDVILPTVIGGGLVAVAIAAYRDRRRTVGRASGIVLHRVRSHAHIYRDLNDPMSHVTISRRPAPCPDASGEHVTPIDVLATYQRPSDDELAAIRKAVMPEQRLGRALDADEIAEVTSGCELCGGELEHEPDCPQGVLIDMMPDQDDYLREGDLMLPPQPNIGGEGHPDYQGPHYSVAHDRFVPYDVLRDPPEGAAVHLVGSVACVGPLPKDESDGE